MTAWPRIARRIRVPAGFLFAALYLWFARPRWPSLIIGGAIIAPGLCLRAVASGYLKKNVELATSGPYAYTRNPLYLGSIIIAAGFAAAAMNVWIILAMLVIFFAIYLPVIQEEESLLRAKFAEFPEYFARVPMLLPRPRRAPGTSLAQSGFSRELYMQHREYNAVIGAAAMLLALALKILWRQNAS